jgi:hypothetical protein
MQSENAMKKAAFAVFLALTLLVGLTAGAWAQSAGTGGILGTVKDPSGAVVAGAEVTVKNIDTGAERKFRTTDTGVYSAPYLQPGRYEVRARKEGFAEVIRQNLVVEVGQTLTANIDLPLRAAVETVTVTSEAALVDTTKTEVSQNVNQDQVENLPLNGRRWDNLALLTPGASEDGGFGLVSFRGVSALYNNNMVDGADNNQAFFSEARGRTRIGYGYSINSIKEFQVQTAAYTAEYGRAAGGVVNAVTKSGTNDWHGDFFYFIRDKAFLARDPIGNVSGVFDFTTGTTIFGFKPDERRQQYGGSFSGPLVKDKLFFFLNYDRQKRNFPIIHSANQNNFFQFGTGGGQQANTCILPATATATLPAFTNTMAQCQAVLNALLPITNVVAPRQGNQDLGLAKGDYQWNANNRVSAVFNILRWDSPNGIQTAAVLRGTSPLANGSDIVKNEFITVTWNSVWTSSLVNEAKFQYGRDFEAQIPNASGPQIQLQDGTNFGMPNFLPRGRFPDEKRYQWADNVSWLKGRHQVKFGVDINHVRDDIQNLFNGTGIYSYSGTDALRRFVFELNSGMRAYNSFTQATDPVTGSGVGMFTTNDYNFYFQDNIKLWPNFTVNLGVRYELQDLPEPPQPNPLIPESATLNTDTNNFAPRVGFSWGIGKSQKQVLRGGYGMYYGRTQNSTLFVHMFQNGIFQRTINVGTASCGAPTLPNTLFPMPSTAPPFGPIFGTSGPTPTATFSDFAAYAAACPGPLADVAFQTLSPDFVNPLVHQYDVAYEAELPWKLGVTANYIGSRANHLPIFFDVNLPPPATTRTYRVFDGAGAALPIAGTSNEFTVPFFLVVPTSGAAAAGALPRPRAAQGVRTPVIMGQSIVNSWYNAFVLRVRRRESKGFSFDANYTLSKSIDNGQVLGTFGTFFGTNSPLNPKDLKSEYGLSDSDIRNRFILNLYWVAPFANWTDNEGLKRVIGGWKFSGVIKLQDGRPITAGMAGRPSCSGTASGSGAGGLTCGTSNNSGTAINGRVPFIERNSQFTQPGLATVDFRAGRVFKITERADVELLWEAFNLFNRTNTTGVQTGLFDFANPGATISPTGVTPTITCPTAASLGNPTFNGCLIRREAPRVTPSNTFGATSATSNTLYTARQMQFGVKFRF